LTSTTLSGDVVASRCPKMKGLDPTLWIALLVSRSSPPSSPSSPPSSPSSPRPSSQCLCVSPQSFH
jgi:hypothetical protein